MDEQASERKHKRDRSESKKRPSQEDGADGADGHRKHKKSKKQSRKDVKDDEDGLGSEAEPSGSLGKANLQKSQKKSSASTAEDEPSVDTTISNGTLKKSKKEKRIRPNQEEDSATLELVERPKKSKRERREREAVQSLEEEARNAGATPAEKLDVDKSGPQKEKQRKDKKHKSQHALGEADSQPIAEPEGDRDTLTSAAPNEDEQARRSKEKKKAKKDKHKKQGEEEVAEEENNLAKSSHTKPDSRKRKSEKPTKEKQHAKHGFGVALSQPDDGMDIDVPESSTAAVTGSVETPQPDFPLFGQTVSFYVPFAPAGFDMPLTNATKQFIEPLMNQFSPLLNGVLLSYKNVNLSETPVRKNPKHPADDQTPVLLNSIDEYAVGFGFLTADVDVFVPRRGAWMEGNINLQSESHVGVVCWGRFSASIERKRLPRGWKWIDLTKKTAKSFAGDNQMQDADNQGVDSQTGQGQEADEEEDDVLDDEAVEGGNEMFKTGYWVDAEGESVIKRPVLFQIKNFDVGLAGEYGYLSIEGTMLNRDAEKDLAAREREQERLRKQKDNPTGLLRPLSRRVPEFSVTKLGKEEQEEDSGQRSVLYKGSRRTTPDDDDD